MCHLYLFQTRESVQGTEKTGVHVKSTIKPWRYITNRRGRKTGVVLAIEDYKKFLADLEELNSIRACDEAKLSGDEAILFLTATKEIERSRN